MSTRDFLQALAVTFLWALCYPFIAIAIDDAPPLLIGAWRSTLAGVALLGVAKYQRRARPSMPTLGWIALAGLGLATLGFTGMFLSGGRIAPGTATVLSNVQPLIAAIIGVVILGERVGGRRGLVLTLGFAGIALTAIPSLSGAGNENTSGGVAFVALGAAGVAVGNVTMRRIADRIDPVVAAGWALLLGSIPLWIISVALGDALPFRISLSLVVTVAVLALLGTALALVLWLDLLRRYELLRVNIFSFMTTVFGLVIGGLFFGETWGLGEWFGIALTLSAVVAMALLRPLATR